MWKPLCLMSFTAGIYGFPYMFVMLFFLPFVLQPMAAYALSFKSPNISKLRMYLGAIFIIASVFGVALGCLVVGMEGIQHLSHKQSEPAVFKHYSYTWDPSKEGGDSKKPNTENFAKNPKTENQPWWCSYILLVFWLLPPSMLAFGTYLRKRPSLEELARVYGYWLLYMPLSVVSFMLFSLLNMPIRDN